MSVITTINSTDLITNSRTDINNNFANLNAGKIETSVLDTDTSLTANSDLKVASQKAVKAYVDAGGNVNASTTSKGIVQEATVAQIAAGTAAGSAARLYINPSSTVSVSAGVADAGKIPRLNASGLLDSSISTSPFIVQDVALSTTANNYANCMTAVSDGSALFLTQDIGGSSITIYRLAKDATTNNYYITNTATLTVNVNSIYSLVVQDIYLYVACSISGTISVRRYLAADLTGVTSMTISGTAPAGYNSMFSDGTNIYISNGTTDQFNKYSLSGTTLTFVSTITYTSSGTGGSMGGSVCDGTNVWITNSAGGTTFNIRKYALAGGAAVSTTSPIFIVTAYYGTSSVNNCGLFFGSAAILGIGWTFNAMNLTANIGLMLHLVGIKLP